MSNIEYIYLILNNLGYDLHLGFAPQNATLPFIIYNEINSIQPFGFTSRLKNQKSNYQIDIYDKTLANALVIEQDIDEALEANKIYTILASNTTFNEDEVRIRKNLSLYK